MVLFYNYKDILHVCMSACYNLNTGPDMLNQIKQYCYVRASNTLLFHILIISCRPESSKK